MPHVLRVPSDVTLEAIRSALAAVRTQRVAVIFPLGRPSRIGTAETMQDLHSYALVLGKDVIMIGGDPHLRAAAVAAGFAAATSLEEWEETQPELRAVTVRGGPTRPLWELTDLAIVSDDWFAISLPGALDYPYTDEPPPYVQELLAAGIADLDAGSSNMPDDPPDGATDDELDPDTENERALLDAHEHYEDHITMAIRESGGVSRPLAFEIRRLTTHTGDLVQPVSDDEADDSPAL